MGERCRASISQGKLMTSFMDGPYAKLPCPWCQQMFVLLLFRSLCHQAYVSMCYAGPSEGLKIRGCQYYLVGIICPPWLR